MNNLMIFEGKNVEIILGENNEPLFELYSVGQALGYESVNAKGNFYPRKARIDGVVENNNISVAAISGSKYLKESQLYKFIMKSNTKAADPFMDWVTEEVLPSIRQNGAYVSPNITEEQENNLTRYGLPSHRKDLFLNVPVEQIGEVYKECMEYNSKKAAPERVKIEKEIVATLSNRVDTALENKNAALALVVQTEISKIQKKLTERSNRSYGARLGNVNRKLNMVTKQLEEAHEYILDIQPTEDEYNCLNIHGFTINRQYAPNVTEYGVLRTDFNKNPRFIKTEAYSRWIEAFNKEMDKLDLDINFDNGIDVYLYFDHMSKFDASNFHKSFFDCLANYYGVNDNNFHLKMCDTYNLVDSYEEGKIWFAIRERAAK